MILKKQIQKQVFKKTNNPSKPFVINFPEKHYVLTQEQFCQQTDGHTFKRKRWDYISLNFISFKDNCLQFKADNSDWETIIRLEIAADKLMVTCHCGNQSDKICVHAFKVLDEIITARGDYYFERYQPAGKIALSLKHPQFFTKTVDGIEQYFRPKKQLGTIYQFTNENITLPLESLLQLPAVTQQTPATLNSAMVYMLMFPPNKRFTNPTFLLPCLGIKNKEGTDLKAFEKFLSGTEKDYEKNLTEEQKTVNRWCYEIWKHAENANRYLIDEENDQDKIQAIFCLWEKVVPLLQRQENVYQLPFFGTRYLKGKPLKKYMHRIIINSERAKLFFQLTNKDAYYQLALKIEIGNKVVSQFDASITFFIVINYQYYLVASLRDAGILEWMHQAHNRITIFKEHFADFEESCLNQLRKYYPVKV
ncbi:hypothetical protein [Arachidicoccus sp.]|uniref:hypothetical protein n=1 Tax=Arachidicoccus sp. TaxID=1872624 RepID=UPI003D1B9417